MFGPGDPWIQVAPTAGRDAHGERACGADVRTPRCLVAGVLGASVAEVLVALLLGLLLLTLSTALLARERALTRELASLLAVTETSRSARHLLRAEVGSAWPEGVGAPAADSLSLRAFRGHGLPCGVSPRGTYARVSGIRGPSAKKDSLWILYEDWTQRVVALDAARPAPPGVCPEGALPVVALVHERNDTAVPILIRYFERGTYHLSGGALRYRRGGGGRQPLTPEHLDTRRSAFVVYPDGRLGLTLVATEVESVQDVSLGRPR